MFLFFRKAGRTQFADRQFFREKHMLSLQLNTNKSNKRLSVTKFLIVSLIIINSIIISIVTVVAIAVMPEDNAYRDKRDESLPINKVIIRLYAPEDKLGILINRCSGDVRKQIRERYPEKKNISGVAHAAYLTPWFVIGTTERILIESVLRGVQQTRESFYGSRPYIDIDIALLGVDPKEFHRKIQMRIGQEFDILALFTKGFLNVDNRVVCIELINECLPDNVRADIAKMAKKGTLPPGSVAIYGKGISPKDIFLTPNGLLAYYLIKTKPTNK